MFHPQQRRGTRAHVHTHTDAFQVDGKRMVLKHEVNYLNKNLHFSNFPKVLLIVWMRVGHIIGAQRSRVKPRICLTPSCLRVAFLFLAFPVVLMQTGAFLKPEYSG